MLTACVREQEIAEAIRGGQWPLGCEPELRAHVAGCGRCREMVTLTTVFQQARAQTGSAVQLPDAGLLWWRAQLRRRSAAIEAVNRPLAGAQVVALVVNLAALVALTAWQANHGVRWLGWWDSVQQQMQGVDWLAMLHGTSLVAGLVVGSLALLGGVAAWLAADR